MYELEAEPSHVLQVAKLAMLLFDRLRELHSLTPQDRLILEGAACLHDIGRSISPGGLDHHKASAKLIRKRRWNHWDEQSVEVMALVARYHRRALPDVEQKDFGELEPPDQSRVEHLAAFLRMADGLDRSHRSYVSDLGAKIEEAEVAIHLKTTEFADREIAAAKAKSDLAQRVFKREFLFTAELVPATRATTNEHL
jgi:exopolyphosphatase/guanosine-5'-triphosphate,3'-diphosphate pyrophosphatase